MKKTLSIKLFAGLLTLGAMVGCNNGEPDIKPDSEKVVDHLIFKEICYSGTWHPKWGRKGGPYTYDSYLVIENPTDKTLYLDSLGIAQSGLSCNKRRELRKGTDFRNDFFGAFILVQFPGSGHDYPVAPHTSVLLAARAVDHTKERTDEEGYFNPDSYDLSQAKFEWLTEEQIEEEDIFKENPNVPNMRLIYPTKDTSARELIPQYGALALVKLPVKTDDLLHSNTYYWHTYWTTAEKTGKGGVAEDGGHSHDAGYDPVVFLKIPNDWVIDCVQICPQQDYQWNVIGETLDKGYTSVMTSYKDKERNPQSVAGLSLQRRHDGNKYVDTNNSNFDFEKKPASLHKKTTVAQ